MQEDNVLTLPASAFSFTPMQDAGNDKLPEVAGDADTAQPGKDQRRVWVLSDNKLIPTIVTTGVSNGLKTVITGGLSEGAEVAVGYSTPMPGGGKEEARSPFAPQPPGRNKKK